MKARGADMFCFIVSVVLTLLITPAFGAGAQAGGEKVNTAGAGQLPEQDSLSLDDGGNESRSFEEEPQTIFDPLEPFNRAMFYFNDKLYFWAFKPVSQGYRYVVPQQARVGVRRFLSNIATPGRFINALLQLKFKHAGTELERFVLNTTIGVGGLMDPARDLFKLSKHEEDFGQTLGFYGIGPGLYINWPLLGPSSVRDTVGMTGDLFLDPLNYVFLNTQLITIGIGAYGGVNETSLEIDRYEDFKKGALDPYLFMRDAYHQHRESKTKE